MSANARLELQLPSAQKKLIERAAEISNLSVGSFATKVLLDRAHEIVDGPKVKRSPRPIGGWSFELPEDWDAPLEELAEYR